MRSTTRNLLESAWAALEGDPTRLSEVDVRDDDSALLPSRLAALSAMVAAVSAATVLGAARRAGLTGTIEVAAPARVLVDARHVALAARSEHYARGPGAPVDGFFAPLSRFWPTADGWIRLHANYPWHRERALRVLGGREDQVGRAIGRWPGAELEQALTEVGALGVVVRTPEQWQAHDQGRALRAVDLVDRTPLGTGNRRRGPSSPGLPAAGLRVLDLTRVIAGPVATRTLAGWGAQVLRLDSPRLPEIPAQALDALSGKHSASIDFATRAGRRRLHELLGDADLLVMGYRPGALDAFGLGPHQLADTHPQLAVVSLSAWGAVGPWASRRGFDSLVQCATGIAVQERVPAAVGAPTEPPRAGEPGVLPAQVLDHATGYLAAAGAMLALSDVARGGPARHVQVSLAQTARWLQSADPLHPDGPPEEPAPSIDREPYLTTLSGPAGPVRVIGPPGRLNDLAPRWTGTTTLGADPPSWA